MYDVAYVETADGRREFWVYAPELSRRVYVSPAWVAKELKRGTIKLVDLDCVLPMR